MLGHGRHLQNCKRCLIRSACAVLVYLVGRPHHAFRGVVEGDTSVELFLNGVYVRTDDSLPALPLNGQRRYDTANENAFPIFLSQPFTGGDVIGLRIATNRVTTVDWLTAIGTSEQYPGLGAAIAAFEDGTLTNELWRCSPTLEENWHTKEFDDAEWPFAVVQNRSCCPWRDQTVKWIDLNSKWIAPANFDASDSGVSYCRYKIPPSQRLMDGSLVDASPTAPALNVTAIDFATHAAGVSFSVSSRSNVYCMICDARFILRTPSPLEIEAHGDFMEVDGWTDVTVGHHHHHYDIQALAWHNAGSSNQCEALCDNYVPAGAAAACAAITYFESGVDPTTNKNCKLMEQLDNSLLILDSSLAPSAVKHYARQDFPTAAELSISGLFYPSTLYSAFCSARSVLTNKHATWAMVEATRFTGRTSGCASCGASPTPLVKIMGGWASKDSIAPVVWSSRPGRVFCAARPLPTNSSPFTLTIADIKASSIDLSRHFSLIGTEGSSAFVAMSGLAPATLHEVACLAETDSGGLSTQANLDDTRLRWSTEAVIVPIGYMGIVRNDASLDMATRLSVIGFLWCQVVNTTFTQQYPMPTRADLMDSGVRIAVTDLKFDAIGQFPLSSTTLDYLLFCTGRYDDFTNVTGISIGGIGVDYPVASIIRYTLNVDEVQLLVHLDRGPTSTYCRPFRWATRPFSYRPHLPTVADMKASSYHQNTFNTGGAGFLMVFPGLATGSLYDIYCYSEEFIPPPPPGSLPPAARGMTSFAVEQTRITLKTQGPRYNDGGWTCTVGHTCKIWNIVGDGLTAIDKLIAQEHQCVGRCICSGQEDPDRKGATCSQVSHERHIVPPDPHSSDPAKLDGVDPQGSWCYVTPGTCFDQQPSPTFSNRFISYAACKFQNTTVGVPGSGPPDFPNNGIAQLASTTGTAYDFGVDPLFVGGASYPLCWCNGTTSSCVGLADYNLRIGVLHIAGPTVEQKTRVMRCIAGHPCVLRQFKGHALSDGNRLVVLPDTPQGCMWQRESPGHQSSVPGFPQYATSDAATDGGATYSWGSIPVRADGGTYLLCWCGSVSGPEYNPTPNCPFPRPLTGASYLAPAGRLLIAGPLVGSTRFCNVGVECVIENVPGEGLQGGDKMAILHECGKSAAAPSDWTAGVGGNLPQSLMTRFIPEGWMQYGPVASDADLNGFGAPPYASSQSSRGVFGMPNNGISLSDSRPGYYAWGAATEAEPGDYVLCWCPTEFECSKPDEFQVMVSPIRLRGPLVLPSASQARVCVRGRQCQVTNLTGVWPTTGGQLFIAGSLCGGPVALGAPRNGISMTSSNGNTFTWGQEAIASPPGKYRLCWCFQKFACTEPAQFGSFAGILLVKAPFGPLRQFYCAIGVPCIIQDVFGEGGSATDQVMAMAACGDGDGSMVGFEGGRAVSNMTGPDGTWFRMPSPVSGGSYRMCWCAGESLCYRGADFDHDLGELIVGGPSDSALYKCYEWTSCSIEGLLGTSLKDGDRIRVVPPSTNCSSMALPIVDGFPQGGLGAPATDAGTTHSFGADKVRSTPGVYSLCYCSVLYTGGACNDSTPFELMAGQLRIGTAKEYKFLTRDPEPEERNEDSMYAVYLILPAALVAIGVVCFGVVKITTVQHHNKELMAKKPFPKILSWADHERSRRKRHHEVKQVDCQRKIVNGTADGSERIGTDMLAIPDVSGVHAPFFQRVARPLHMLEDIAKGFQSAQLAVEDLTLSPSALTNGNQKAIENQASVSTPTTAYATGTASQSQAALPMSQSPQSHYQSGQARLHSQSPQSHYQPGKRSQAEDAELAQGTSRSKPGIFQRLMPSWLFGSRSRDPTQGVVEIREIRHASPSPGRQRSKEPATREMNAARTLTGRSSEQSHSSANQARDDVPVFVSSPFSVFSLDDWNEEYGVHPEHLLHFERDPRRYETVMKVLDM